VRTLVIATEYPWPCNSGSRLRLATVIDGLSRCGPTELFSAVSDTRTDFDEPPARCPLERVERIGIDDRPPGPADIARGVLAPTVPFELPRRARNPVSRALRRFATGRYDLLWYFQVRAFVLAPWDEGHTPSLVDFVDLEDEKILARAALPREAAGPVRHLRRRAGRMWSEEEARRWRALHRRVAGHCSATVVCSDLDARRLGLPGVRVIPNGYPPPPRPVGRLVVSAPPVVMFQGTLRYPPNADASRFLVRDIGPRLRALVPEARIRLVGLTPPELDSLADPPAVTLTGQVPDIVDELARADVVVVPLRYASGTRLKILEAFAHRIPVVSTTVGAEGLDVDGDRHLILADDAESIARACARVLGDEELRRALVERAHALYLDRYQTSSVEEQVAALARSLAR
jgi:glycosyltransferase involved in cell wall biosynthesis